jgi:hypothetical protein
MGRRGSPRRLLLELTEGEKEGRFFDLPSWEYRYLKLLVRLTADKEYA